MLCVFSHPAGAVVEPPLVPEPLLHEVHPIELLGLRLLTGPLHGGNPTRQDEPVGSGRHQLLEHGRAFGWRPQLLHIDLFGGLGLAEARPGARTARRQIELPPGGSVHVEGVVVDLDLADPGVVPRQGHQLHVALAAPPETLHRLLLERGHRAPARGLLREDEVALARELRGVAQFVQGGVALGVLHGLFEGIPEGVLVAVELRLAGGGRGGSLEEFVFVTHSENIYKVKNGSDPITPS